jgi:hypothetical protein
MKQLSILIIAFCAMSWMASESKAQAGFSYGSFRGGQAFSISVGGGGFYGPGFGHHHHYRPFYGGGFYAPVVPVYRPIYGAVPVIPVYGGPWGGGHWGGGHWGGGCRHGW